MPTNKNKQQRREGAKKKIGRIGHIGPIGEHKVQVLDVWPNDILMVQFDDRGGMASREAIQRRSEKVVKLLRGIGIQNRLLFLAKDIRLTVVRQEAPAKGFPANPWDRNPWDLVETETGPRQVLGVKVRAKGNRSKTNHGAQV